MNIYNSVKPSSLSERPSRIRFAPNFKSPPKTLPPLAATTTTTAAAAATIKGPPKTKSERKKEENERARLLMMKIKNLRDLIEEQKENETRLTTEIEALEWSKTQREDKVGRAGVCRAE